LKTNFRDNTNFLFVDYETTGLNFDSKDLNKTDFPIEVGCILTNSDLTILDTYQSLILSQEVYNKIAKADGAWPTEYYTAYQVHKIETTELLQYGKYMKDVVIDLTNFVDKNKSDIRTRTIIVSDNAQFEYNLTKFLYDVSGKKFPFHYTAWDTSMLLEATGVRDPKPVHRAFGDTSLVYQAVIRAMEKINGFG
jgi:oligoribonuclease (3'-5' exoribonuclease)